MKAEKNWKSSFGGADFILRKDTKMCARPFLFHYRSTLLSQSLLRMIFIFASRGNYLCFARVFTP